MNVSICPSPYSLTRVAAGSAGPEEANYVREHAVGCLACRQELAGLEAQGPTDAWNQVAGDAGPMPDTLWQAVSEALRLPPVRLRCRIEAGAFEAEAAGSSTTAPTAWLDVVSGEAELVPLTGGATRGAPASGVPVAGKLRLGAFEALIRRGPGRLTVVVTRNGEPAPAQTIRLTPEEPGLSTGREGAVPRAGDPPAAGRPTLQQTRTDSDGIAVFPRLAAGDYLLELEGLNS